MKFFPTRTTFLKIGNLTIQWYALCLLSGVLVAYLFSKRNLKKYKNIDINEFFDDMFLYALWFGIIGARLWFCAFDANFNYLKDPLQIIRIWDGGLAIHGALIGGGLTVYYFCKKRGVSMIKVSDAILPTVLIGQAIGRWGNFVNQECYGFTVDESYYDGILKFIKSSMFINGQYREPMFLYESVACLIGFFLINFFMRKKQTRRGELSWCYLMWYGTVRFFIEGHRQDSLMMKIIPLRTAQVTSIVFVVIGILGYIGVFDKLLKKKKPTIIFDLDGTLIHSKEAIIKTYEEIFKRRGKIDDFTCERRIEVIGPAIDVLLAKYFPNENVGDLVKEYDQLFKTVQDECIKPMKNAEEVLKTLKDEGYDIGVVTSRDTNSSFDCLKIAGLDSYIKDLVSFDDVKNLKPDIEGFDLLVRRNKFNKADLVVVGDSVADIEGGFNYGAYTVAIVSEEAKRQSLTESHTNKVIDDLNELLEILKEKHNFTYNLS